MIKVVAGAATAGFAGVVGVVVAETAGSGVGVSLAVSDCSTCVGACDGSDPELDAHPASTKTPLIATKVATNLYFFKIPP